MDISLLLGLLVLVLIALVVVKKRQGQSKKGSEAGQKSKSPASKAASEKEKSHSDESEPSENSEEIFGWDNSTENATVSVSTVDPLTEYKVYKQFGYLEKAAESLLQYLKSQPSLSEGITKTLLLELADLLIETEQLDELSEIIGQYRDILGKEDAEKLILRGLEIDNNQLALRVLAEEIMNWDVQDVANELGLADSADGINHHLSSNEKAAESITENNIEEINNQAQATPSIRYDLVLGEAEQWQINKDERDVLLGFAKPEHGYKLLKGMLVYDVAIRCLNKAIQQSEKPASLIIDALTLDYRNNKISIFAQHLWRLYYTLGQYGTKVKERMLGWGYNLGDHPMFEELATYPNEQKLREIGFNQGYITRSSSSIKAKRKPLVENIVSDDRSAHSASEIILQEVESLLTYGQLDQAIEVLENSIWDNPQESQLYIALFDLCERAEEWQKLEDILRKIREKVKTPPEEVVLAMSQVSQRINHGGVQ